MENFTIRRRPERSKEWKCHLFGSGEEGLTYFPLKEEVPNWFVRWMMKICLGCVWVRNKVDSKKYNEEEDDTKKSAGV